MKNGLFPPTFKSPPAISTCNKLVTCCVNFPKKVFPRHCDIHIDRQVRKNYLIKEKNCLFRLRANLSRTKEIRVQMNQGLPMDACCGDIFLTQKRGDEVGLAFGFHEHHGALSSCSEQKIKRSENTRASLPIQQQPLVTTYSSYQRIQCWEYFLF